MSTTRHAAPGSPLRQERYASTFTRGLLANLVAKRCALLERAEDRRLIWWLQWLSWQPGGLSGLPAGELEAYCLDPRAELSERTLGALRAFRGGWIEGRSQHLFQTGIGKRVADALDYARSARTLCLVDGPSRIGKTFAARAWCAQSAGLARYVEVPCATDDTAFFHRIARALGLGAGVGSKAMQLRVRVEDTLHLADGDLMLVMDEAHYCWPTGRLRHAVPDRINWINTALANFGVPVALITTPQFYDAQRHVEKQTGWNSSQFVGRIGHVERLPERLARPDLMGVAAVLLPEGSARTHTKLAVYAEISKKHLASIEAIVNRARWLAEKEGLAKATEEDVDRAISESVIPSDSALAVSLRQNGRNGGAAASLNPRGNGVSHDFEVPAARAPVLSNTV